MMINQNAKYFNDIEREEAGVADGLTNVLNPKISFLETPRIKHFLVLPNVQTKRKHWQPFYLILCWFFSDKDSAELDQLEIFSILFCVIA